MMKILHLFSFASLVCARALSLPDAHETVEIAKTIREVARPIPTIELSITPSGPLVECEDVILSWANDTISKDVALTYNVYSSVIWEHVDDEGKLIGEVSFSSECFATPSTEFLYHVNYPAGSIFSFNLHAWSSSNTLFRGSSGNYTVQPGKSTKCIPKSHYPVIFDVQPVASTVTECEPLKISWTGGDSPSYVYLRSTDRDAPETDFSGLYVKTDTGGYFGWVVDYPVGTELIVSLYGRNSGFSASHRFTVETAGQSNKCISQVHRYGRFHLGEHPFVIAGIVVASVIGAILVAFGIWKGYKYWLKKRGGRIQLPE